MKLILVNLSLLIFICKSTCYSESDQASSSIQEESKSSGGGSSSNGGSSSEGGKSSSVKKKGDKGKKKNKGKSDENSSGSSSSGKKSSGGSSEGSESKSGGGSSEESGSSNTITFEHIKKHFQLSNEQIKSFKSTFKTDDLILVSPTSFEDSDNLNIFLVVAKKLKSDKNEVLIKFQMKSNVTAWINENDKSTECTINSKQQQSLIPMEYYISKEMNGKQRFQQFYPDDSNIKDSKSIYLTFNHLKNSINLYKWFKQITAESDKKKDIEKNLKIFFKQIHESLLMLKKKNYIYTDLKPENILINMNNKKGSVFLINMNNVVTLKKDKLNQICSISNEFFPPVDYNFNEPKSSMINSYFKMNNHKSDSLLIWTFCATLMSLVCPSFDKKRESHFKNRIIHSLLKSKQNSILKGYLNCDENIQFPGKLKSFLDKCLRYESEIKKFEDLLKDNWFNE
jgi:hypothetical protein